MPYGEAKVYFDGSHYIAIPHTEKPTKPRKKPIEEEITIFKESEENEGSEVVASEPSNSFENEQIEKDEQVIKDEQIEPSEPKIERIITKKELFEELYTKYIDLKRKDRKKKIIEEMLPHFEKREHCESYVQIHMDRKQRNLICRRIRMCRKANLANFNYFCTFTYDDKLHTEQSFKKKLRNCFKNLCLRKNWKYMGVWERAPKTNRLHFHGLFEIPKDSMPGVLLSVKDYDTKKHKMQVSNQSTYFNEKFGRSDFKEIDEQEKRLGNALAYLMKYIEKSGEKIVYSKGLPQFFISDIMDEDVICTIGQEDKKLLLFDNFNCWDEGVLIGRVCPEVIEQMRKCN